jgi:hypothetical protein
MTTNFFYLLFFMFDPGSEMEKKIRIRDKHPGSETLFPAILALVSYNDTSRTL